MRLFLTIITAGLLLVTSSLAQTEDMRGQTFLLADKDESTALDRKEFRLFINLLAKTGHRNARRVRMFRLYKLAWGRVDKDGNGLVTRNELIKANPTDSAISKQTENLTRNNQQGLLGSR